MIYVDKDTKDLMTTNGDKLEAGIPVYYDKNINFQIGTIESVKKTCLIVNNSQWGGPVTEKSEKQYRSRYVRITTGDWVLA
jgi:hypothetical protein